MAFRRVPPAVLLSFILGFGVCALIAAAIPSRPPEIVQLKILAPWSFELRIRRVFEDYERQHPLTQFVLVTGMPGKLMKFMKEFPDGDVYVAMGPAELEQLRKMGRLKNGLCEPLVTQHIALVRPARRKGAEGTFVVRSIQDLARPEVKSVGLGRPTATAGTVARKLLQKAGILDKVEPKGRKAPLFRAFVGQVAAAFVYEECLFEETKINGQRPMRPGVEMIKLFDEPDAAFDVIAVQLDCARHPEAARDFIHFLKKQLPHTTEKELPNVLRVVKEEQRKS